MRVGFRTNMAEELSDKELGRRLSAGRGYRRESIREFAERIDVDRHDLTKWELGDFGSKARRRVQDRNRKSAVERVQTASGLPPEFFVIDLKDLPEMHAAWQRVQAEASTPEGMVQAQERDEAETLPPGPSESQTEEQEP